MQLIGWRHLKNYFSTSLWAVPILAIPFAMIATRALHWLDAKTEWTLLGFGVPGAQATLQAVVTASLSFLVFTFGSLLVAIQVASGQLTPRIIATTLLRNDVVRYTVGSSSRCCSQSEPLRGSTIKFPICLSGFPPFSV